MMEQNMPFIGQVPVGLAAEKTTGASGSDLWQYLML